MTGDASGASTTALGNLALACLATSEPDPTVRSEDPVAPQLLRWSDGAAAAARIRTLHPLIRGAVERLIPGIYGYGLARGHHIDQIVRREVSAGLDALVIVGAGYDTRPYRLQEVAGLRVFEVDRPATSREKQGRVAKALGLTPPNVSFVEADLARQNFLKELAGAGHEPASRTMFLLSGVSMYLSSEAMANLFDQVASRISNRTSLIFDYVDANVFTEPDLYYGGEWLRRAAKAGEEPRWGIPAGETEAHLATHGLRLDSDIDARELEDRYLRGADGSAVARPFDFGAIAHAFIEPGDDESGLVDAAFSRAPTKKVGPLSA
jgi:methyltransferase (TIGR00027 family)